MSDDYRPRSHFMCLNVEGFMRNERYPRGYNIFETDDGKPMTPQAALAFLTMEKAKGRKVIPMSSQCGNPCTHAAEGCAGFDYSGSGCDGWFAAAKVGDGKDETPHA